MGLFKKDNKNSEASFSVEVKSSIGMGTDDTVQRLLKEIILPKDNERDLEDVPQHVRDELRFVLAERVDEVVKESLGSISPLS